MTQFFTSQGADTTAHHFGGVGKIGRFLLLLPAILWLLPTASHAIDLQQDTARSLQYFPPDSYMANDIFQNSFKLSLLKTSAALTLPYEQMPIITGSFYAVKKRGRQLGVFDYMQYSKKISVPGLGMIANIRWPLVTEDLWSLYLNGNISSSLNQTAKGHNRNRWNFEHQLGCDAKFQLKHGMELTIGARHYRIMDVLRYEDPARSYIKSNGAFITLQLQY